MPSSHLSVVRSPSSVTSKRNFKMTLWLSPEEYIAVMRMSADLERGKVSFNKWFRKITGIESTKSSSPKRAVNRAIKKMHIPPQTVAHSSPRKRIAA